MMSFYITAQASPSPNSAGGGLVRRTMSDITSKIPADDAMPCHAKPFIKLFVNKIPTKIKEPPFL